MVAAPHARRGFLCDSIGLGFPGVQFDVAFPRNRCDCPARGLLFPATGLTAPPRKDHAGELSRVRLLPDSQFQRNFRIAALG